MMGHLSFIEILSLGTSTSLSALRIVKPLREGSHFVEHSRLSVKALEVERMLIACLKP